MALRAIDQSEHTRLLQKINNLPFEEAQAAKFEQQLNKFYGEYHALLTELAVAIESYRKVAAKINERQPLVKRKEPHFQQ